jgi:flagellar biosynthesis/type III secretory pathway protein FliH
VSFLLWQRGGAAAIASSRRVLRAAEVPLFAEANQLRDMFETLRNDQAQAVAAAAKQARAQGHAQGLEEGRRAARDELADKLTALAQAAERDRAQLRSEIAVLALQVVRKLMGEFADADRLIALAATAVQDLLPAQAMTLVVHPDLCETVRARLAALAGEASPPPPPFEVRGDADCAPAECHIETEHGSIDASLESQLQRLAAAWSATPQAN